MRKKRVRFSSIAFFLFIILLTMWLSRMEEGKKAAALQNPTENVPVLMYHHLLSKQDSGRYANNDIVTFVEDFEQQLVWLKENGYQTISPEQLVNWFYAGAALPGKPVMLTFDDGYLSNYIYAYPLLKQYGFSAVIFSVTAKISEAPASFQSDKINMLDAQTMHKAADVFYYASHTNDLHTLHGKHSALVDASTETAAADISASQKTLSAFSSYTPALFSYPYGNYSDKAADVLKQSGVQLAFRATKGTLTRQSDPYALPRYPVSHKISFKTFKSYFS